VTTALAAVDHELGRVPAAKEGFRRARTLLKEDARAARHEAFAILSTVLDGEDAMRAATKPAVSAGKKSEPEEVRFARRVLARRIEGRAADSERTAHGIIVAGDASWLRVPSGETVRLGRARALARIVRELALERVRHPGRPVTAEELVRAGWPDERIVPSAAKNRLHVSITRLRKLGLEDAILREAEGYLFDPGILLTVSDV
jgi:DNA-binding response OmpR family regulator